MAHMSPVEIVQTAAARLRDRATHTTEPPWELNGTSTLYMNGRAGYNIRTAGVPGIRLTLTATPADAGWIGMVHPGLAEPLAALLEIEAERGPTGAALRVAQVVLGDGGDVQ